MTLHPLLRAKECGRSEGHKPCHNRFRRMKHIVEDEKSYFIKGGKCRELLISKGQEPILYYNLVVFLTAHHGKSLSRTCLTIGKTCCFKFSEGRIY
jgi:hypothetical protein